MCLCFCLSENAIAPYACSSYNIACLVLVRSPRLARSCLRRTASLALHLSRRKAAAIVGGLGCVALGVSLLAAEAEFVILLLALVATRSSFTAVGLGVVGLKADIEEVFLVGLGDICTLTFCNPLACTYRAAVRVK
jgi:hypothetical protein